MFLLNSSVTIASVVLPRFDWGTAYHQAAWPFFAWGIPAGLILKLIIVKSITALSWKRSAVADAAINLVSSGLDFISVPLVGFLVEEGERLLRLPNYQRYMPTSWLTILFIVALIHSLLETSALRLIFKERIGRRKFWLLVFGNVICLSIAVYGVLAWAYSHPAVARHISGDVDTCQIHMSSNRERFFSSQHLIFSLVAGRIAPF